MKKAIALLTACLFALSAASCGAEKPKDAETAKEKPKVEVYAPGDVLSGALEVAMISSAGYDTFINLFRAEHPGVTVDLITFPSASTARTILSTKIMSGDCYDIIDMWTMPQREYADSGYLVDLEAYMQSDPTFDMGDYNANIFEAMRHKGGLYTMPSGYRCDFISINKNAPAALLEEFAVLDSIGLMQMIDMYNRSGMQGEWGLYKTKSLFFELQNGMENYMDFENGTCNFNTPEYVEKLKLYLDVLGVEDKAFQPTPYEPDANGVYRYNDGPLAAEYLFNDTRWDNYALHLEYDERHFIHTIPYTGDDGAVYARPFEMHSITSFCEDKALAWEFLKFVTSSEPQLARGGFGIPTNRAALENTLTWSLTNEVEYYEESGGPYPTVVEDEFIANGLALYTGLNDMPAAVHIFGGTDGASYDSIFNEELQAFVAGSSTAEQTAANLQARISIALSE